MTGFHNIQVTVSTFYPGSSSLSHRPDLHNTCRHTGPRALWPMPFMEGALA